MRSASVTTMPILVIGAIIAVASVAAILTYGVPDRPAAASASQDGNVDTPQSAIAPALFVQPPAGEAVVTALAQLRIVDAAGERLVPLSAWEGDIGPTWDAGEEICIVGQDCLQQAAVSAVYLERPGSSIRLV